MAPEQGLGDAGGERSDIYSLGVILFQLITGRLPYEADTPLATILKHLNEPAPRPSSINPDIPQEIEDIILKAIAKEPDDRYATAQEMVAHIEVVLGDERLMAGQRRASGAGPLGAVSAAPALRAPAHAFVNLQADKEDTTHVQRRAWPGIRRTLWLLLGIIVLSVAGGVWGMNSGVFPIPPQATLPFTETQVPAASATATLTQTAAPTVTAAPSSTLTTTPAPTETSTNTLTPTASPTRTPTPAASPTLTPTPDITQTLAQATLVAADLTATASACRYEYALIQPAPDDPQISYYPAYTQGGGPVYIRTETTFSIAITLLNTGDCAWERNTSLTWLEGESFNAGPRIFLRDRVEVGAEVTINFTGSTPPRGRGGLRSGIWELRTPGQIAIGAPLTLALFAFDN
jgi:hypothetical protein